MNYIGSKRKLFQLIQQTIQEVVGELKTRCFCDLFSGTGIVAAKMKTKVKQVIANDLEYFSYVLIRNYIGNHQPMTTTKYIHQLNELPGKAGVIYQHYCLGSGSQRQYFSDENGQKIDAQRQQIEQWYQDKTIGADQYYFLLASLLEASDKVANTASVYASFLKKLKASAQKPLWLQPATYQHTETKHQVYQKDANQLITSISGDILYLDPPYNNRQYGNYYHILNTIASYDTIRPKGISGMRDYKKSLYCKKRKVLTAFEELIKNAQFKYIFLSYNNEGLMSDEQIQACMQRYGRYHVKQKKYQRFKADSNRKQRANYTIEALHILEKT
ncbi:MAG: DNA adenine methylase [bacterium]